MSTSIHASIEYGLRTPEIGVSTLGDIVPGVSFSDIFGLLGARFHNEAPTMVPQRGWPKDVGWGFRRAAMALVEKGRTEDEREGDGMVISEDTAERWLRYGSAWLDDDWHGKYRYISDPDIHSVNWITANELAAVVETARQRNPHAHLHGYSAAVAAMRALEADENVTWVRFVYGFDN